LKPYFRCTNLMVGPVPAHRLDLIANMLNQGCSFVVLTWDNKAELYEALDVIPKERLVVAINPENCDELGAEASCSLVLNIETVSDGEDALNLLKETASQVHKQKGKEGRLSIISLSDEVCKHIGREKLEGLVGYLHRNVAGYDNPVHIESSYVQSLLENKDANDEKICAGKSLFSCMKTDRNDGLYATVVTDQYGVAIGFVYSNEESILTSVKGERAVYWSRSRNSLWRKGDTSGAYQTIRSIKLDCDSDAVCFSVVQHGEPASFCHRGSYSCWGDTTNSPLKDTGLGGLFRMLESRKASAPEGSYTKRLFSDRELLKNKLLEESQELIEAVAEGDIQHINEETADVLYFALTACCSGGGTLEKVIDELDYRSLKIKRRPGNAKQHRIDAAKKILEKSK